MPQFHDHIPEAFQNALKSSAELMNVTLDGLERVHNFHVEALKGFRSTHGELTDHLAGNVRVEDWKEKQSELAKRLLSQSADYWSGLYAAAFQNQMELLKEGQIKLKRLIEDVSSNAKVAPSGSEPLVAAWKEMFGIAESAYAATITATQGLVRASTDQVDAPNAQTTGASRQTKIKRAA